MGWWLWPSPLAHSPGSKIPVLLVAQRLDRAGVNALRPVLVAERNGVLGHHCFSRARVSGNEDVLARLKAQHGLLLEGVEGEGVGDWS